MCYKVNKKEMTKGKSCVTVKLLKQNRQGGLTNRHGNCNTNNAVSSSNN